ncbi:hypothetical protein J6590_017798 [Homalodisca vitripennis]|nr:hypothetical protein J6590_017798 [Homalodisca vitripennis]
MSETHVLRVADAALGRRPPSSDWYCPVDSIETFHPQDTESLITKTFSAVVFSTRLHQQIMKSAILNVTRRNPVTPSLLHSVNPSPSTPHYRRGI